MGKSKLIIIGGFLGGGKTTLLRSLAKHLESTGHSVGIITNDQAAGLVDTTYFDAHQMEVEEVSGSCFCCDFYGLVNAAKYLSQIKKCDIILAEPVGSCTDLSATLIQPLKQKYGKAFDIAPLSVVIDPQKFLQMQKVKSEEVGSDYIYFLQIAEADYLLINKVDAVSELEIEQCYQALTSERFTNKLYKISGRKQIGIVDWISELMEDRVSGKSTLEIDYDKYAESEALMGWYNAEIQISHDKKQMIDWAVFADSFLNLTQNVLKHEQITIGHLKLVLKLGADIVKGHLIDGTDLIHVEATHSVADSARMILNARLETDHFIIQEILADVFEAISSYGYRIQFIEKSHFNPLPPRPTYRMTTEEEDLISKINL